MGRLIEIRERPLPDRRSARSLREVVEPGHAYHAHRRAHGIVCIEPVKAVQFGGVVCRGTTPYQIPAVAHPSLGHQHFAGVDADGLLQREMG